MTREALAEQLHGREIGDEISPQEEKKASASRLVVIFGASDDLMEFRGFINDEIGAPGEVAFTIHGKILPAIEDDDREVLERHDVLKSAVAARQAGFQVGALWCADKNGPAWTYKTETPHATFDIMEDGEVYCRGIVIQA